MTVLRLDNVSARPWGTPLLRDINLSLAPGEVLGIIGPNGAGKSSLLRLISQDIPLENGTIELTGRALTAWPLRERACRMAVLPQLSLLGFPYTVAEVVQLGRIPHATGNSADKAIVDEVLDAVDMLHLRQRLYTELSGGERQRTQLARVFAQIWQGAERLLLLDEPTSALDLAHQQQVLATISRLAADGCAVVMVIHDFNLLAGNAGQLLALHEGRPYALGTPGSVLSEQLFREVFKASVHISQHPVHGHPLVVSA